MTRRTLLASVAGALAVLVGLAAWTLRYELLPPSVTGEAARLAEVLALEPGATVAEIGAGRGRMTVALARHVGPAGRMYSTELDSERLADIRAAVASAGLTNVAVLEARERETNLPSACCDAIFMRNVYHHVTDPAGFNRSLRQTVKPGGLVAIIDFEPSRMLALVAGRSPASRTGHGAPSEVVREKMVAAGFEPVRTIDRWGGNMYLLLFRADSSVPGQGARQGAS